MIFNLRACGEMNLSMLLYYLSLYVGKQAYEKHLINFLKVIEIVGYFLPVILGIIPINEAYEPVCMTVKGACTFCAIFITFSNKVNNIESEKLNLFFWIIRNSFSAYLCLSSCHYNIK